MTDGTDVGAVNAGNQETMKARQVSEAANRGADNTDSAANARAAEGLGDDAVVTTDQGFTRQGDDAADAARPKVRLTDGDEMRNSIAANFRRNRGRPVEHQDDADADAQQIQEFINKGGLPAEFQDAFVDDQPADTSDQHTEEPPVQVQPDATPKRKLKVRGKEVEYTEAEILELAQKAAAGDDYLGDAKTVLNEVQAIKRELESRASAAATPAADSTATGTQPSDTGDQHQVDPYRDHAETFLYGDPDTAAGKTRELVASEVPKIVSNVLRAERVRNELARSNLNAQRFALENEDIASDPIAVHTVKGMTIANQREDLAGLGVDVSRWSDQDVMNKHLDYRADPNFAGRVRSSEKLFEDAKARFVNWKGGTPAPRTVDDGTQHQQHEPIQVTVSRDDRRRMIPQQPTRTAVVRQVQQPTAPAPRTHSQAIANMRKARGQAA